MPRISSKEEYIRRLFDFFRENGLQSNMNEISAALGITKKTLYNNFTSKKEMIRTVTGYFYDCLEARIKSSLEDSKNAVGELFAISSVLRHEIDRLGAVLLRDISCYLPEINMMNHTDRLSFYSMLIRENLTRGIRENVYREDINMEYTTLFYTSAIERFYKWDGSYKLVDDSVRFHSELVKYHLYSVVNKRGRELLEEYIGKLD